MLAPPPEQLLAKLAERPGLGQIVGLLESGPRPGGRVLVVGGTVRDLLLERPGSPDIDMVVEGSLERLLVLFGGTSRSHPRFGTVSLELEGVRVDLAEARTETYAHPGALPRVRPATVEQDLERRDFTVNAIAVELSGAARGQLLSFPGALEDLEQRRLATLHDASLIDDPTRLLRLVRYQSRLGFEIAPHTLKLTRDAIAGGALDTVSGTRIGNELRLLATEPAPVAALSALAELGLDTAIEPTFGIGHPDSGAARALSAALTALPRDGRRDLLALAAASTTVPPTSLRALLDRLAFSAHDRDVIAAAASGAPQLTEALAKAVKPSQIADAVGAATDEAIALASALASGASRRNALRWLTDLRHKAIAITGEDLTNAGVPPGPALGAGLRAARAALLDGDAPDRERQLQVALEVARGQLG